MDAEIAVQNAHRWFEHNSGWAPPDSGTLTEWLADGLCRSPDDCMTTPEGWCEHGLASWALILTDVDRSDLIHGAGPADDPTPPPPGSRTAG